MADIRNIMDGVDRAVSGSIEIAQQAVSGAVNLAVQARYERLSKILYDLQVGSDFEGANGECLSVRPLDVAPAIGRLVSLEEFLGTDTRTETTIVATWGEAGRINASQVRTVDSKLDEGATYDSETPFMGNSLHIGGVIRVAKTAQRIQRPYIQSRSSGYGYVSPVE